MPSVYTLAAAAARHGGIFAVDPWSGRVGLVGADSVPRDVIIGLADRWGELEALIGEQRPPDPVAVAEQILKTG